MIGSYRLLTTPSIRFFSHHQVVNVLRWYSDSFFGHVVERFGYGAELLVAAEVERLS